jgi:hypothetical protein
MLQCAATVGFMGSLNRSAPACLSALRHLYYWLLLWLYSLQALSVQRHAVALFNPVCGNLWVTGGGGAEATGWLVNPNCRYAPLRGAEMDSRRAGWDGDLPFRHQACLLPVESMGQLQCVYVGLTLSLCVCVCMCVYRVYVCTTHCGFDTELVCMCVYVCLCADTWLASPVGSLARMGPWCARCVD